MLGEFTSPPSSDSKSRIHLSNSFLFDCFQSTKRRSVSVATVVWEYPIKCSTIKPEVGQYGNSGVGVECWGFDNCGDTNEVRNQSIAIQWGRWVGV